MFPAFDHLVNALGARVARGDLDPALVERLTAEVRHWGPGPWQRVRDLAMPDRRTLEEHWRVVAPRRPSRPHEWVRDLSRGRPAAATTREEYPATPRDYVQLLRTVFQVR